MKAARYSEKYLLCMHFEPKIFLGGNALRVCVCFLQPQYSRCSGTPSIPGLDGYIQCTMMGPYVDSRLKTSGTRLGGEMG